MKLIKKTAILLLGVTVMLGFFGCGNPPVCGGRTNNTNPRAPKVINSRELVSFSAKFYLYGEYGSEGDGTYWFEVKKADDGKLMLTEKYHFYDLKCEAGDNLLSELQKVIVKYDLVKQNGVEEYTNGLPPEYQPCFLTADYESGEHLYFCTNNNPQAGWAKDVFKLCANEFAAHGDTSFLPPPETKQPVRFECEFTDGDMKYRYGELLRQKEGVHYSLEEIVEGKTNDDDFYTVIEKTPWKRNAQDQEYYYEYNIPDEAYYNGLGELIEKLELKNFDNGKGFPSDFDYDGTPCYFQFYAEFEYGNTLSGFADDEETFAEFLPVARQLAEYIDSFIAKDMHIGN